MKLAAEQEKVDKLEKTVDQLNGELDGYENVSRILLLRDGMTDCRRILNVYDV